MKPTKQQELIIAYNGCSVVIASPGSGKTFVLSKKIKQNFKDLKEHQGVIAISYTNKASNELRNRGLSDGENPMSSFFGTIDKFYLSEIIVPFGKQIWGIPENEIVVEKIDSLDSEEQKLLNWFSRDLILSEVEDIQLDILKEFFKQGIILIETIGLLGNYLFNKSLACQKYLKARYKYLYIDEYQDSGYYQHEMFLKIKELGIISTAVGDLNQSIYAFSGKDSKFLESLISDESFKYFVLNKNHRCHPSIINYSNFLLNTKTELLDCEDYLIWFYRIDGAEKDVSEWIDKLIPTILNAFNFKEHNKIAILTRTGRTAQLVNNHLKTNHKLFVSNDLDLNLNVWSGIFSNLLLYLLDSKHRFIEVIEEFTLYEKLNRKQKNELLVLKKRLDKKTDYEELDLKQLKETFIRIAKIIAPESENIDSISLLDAVLREKLEFYSYKPASEEEINIMTLHKSKGLEFDIVIHLDLHEWVFPSKSPGPNNDFNNPIFNDWQQDLNLHYVGITRAKQGCFLVSSTQRTNYKGEIKKGKDSDFIWMNSIEKLRFQNSQN